MQNVKIQNGFRKSRVVNLNTSYKLENPFCIQAGTYLKYESKHSDLIFKSLQCHDTHKKTNLGWFEISYSASQSSFQGLCANGLENTYTKNETSNLLELEFSKGEMESS